MADLVQIFSSQPRHLHDGAAVETVLQHGPGHFEFSFITAFLFADLDTFKAPFLDAFLFKLLCDGHECVCMNASPFARLPLF
ncbi:hypothetical protein ABRF41_005228 [Salmonella enterica]